ncbi:MAG: PAS domain S-box protein [Pseudomonadota bacterium]
MNSNQPPGFDPGRSDPERPRLQSEDMPKGPAKTPTAILKGRILPLALAMLLTLIGVTLFEALKQLIQPDIGIWQSHIATIVFATCIATVAAYFILRHYAFLRSETLNEKKLREQLENQVGKRQVLEARLRNLSLVVEQSPNSILITDREGHIEYVNPRFTEISGYSLQETIGRTPALLKSGEVSASVFKNLWDAIQAGKVWRGKLVNRCKDGTLYWDHVAISPIKNAAGEITHFLSIQTDITEYRKIEEKLRDSDSRVRAIVETAADGIITVDENGIIASFNPAAEQIFGYRGHEVIGQRIDMLIPTQMGAGKKNHFAAYLRASQSKGSRGGVELIGRRKDGSTFPMELAVGEFQDGVSPFFAGIVKDITQRRRAEIQAREHQAELAHVDRLSLMGEMATGLAHELNQPLTSIYAYSQACLRMLRAGNEKSEKFLNAVEQTAQRAEQAGEIIRRLRSFVRKQPPHIKAIELKPVIEKGLKFIEAEARDRSVTIRLGVAEGLPRVLGDAVQLQQVLLNLMRNSIESLMGLPDAERVMTISVREVEESEVQVTVRDTGQGIDKGLREKIFDAFYSTKTNGMGMGLAISRSIIEAHGGRLWATSESPRGASFHFILPVNRGDTGAREMNHG